MSSTKEIADKILNCKTYDIPDIQSLARAYLELENEFQKERQLHKLNVSILDKKDYEVTKLKSENAHLENKLQVTNSNWPYEKELHEEITKLEKSREGLKKALKLCSNPIFNEMLTGLQDEASHGRYCKEKAREALKADYELMGNVFKPDINIFKAPVDGWYSFPGGMFRLRDAQPTELINGEHGIEPKEYLEKIAYKKEDL